MKILKTALICFILCHSTVFANTQNLEVRLSFHDKAMYYQESPVSLKVEIINNNPFSVSMKIAEDKLHNLVLDGQSAQGTKIKISEDYLVSRDTRKLVLLKDFNIEPGEVFGFFVDLNDYLDITDPGLYYIRARFHPQTVHETGEVIDSNILKLSIRPGKNNREDTAVYNDYMFEDSASEAMMREKSAPDVVVDNLLKARQTDRWKSFFLYLDLESLLSQSEDLKNRYIRSGEKERYYMLEDFRSDISSGRAHTEFIKKPGTYEIVKTSYTQDEAQVRVIEKFYFDEYTDIKRYTYYLRNSEGYWLVYNYSVENYGKE